MFEDLQDEEALLGLHDVGEVGSPHPENPLPELLGELPALVSAKEAALALGAAIRKPLGNFAEVFAVLYALQRGFRLLLQVRNLFRLLPLVADFDFPQRDLLRTHEFSLVRLVILRLFLIADGDVRTDFAADYPLRQQRVADVVLEILPIHSLGGNRPLQFFHAREIVLSANGIELLDDFGFYTYAHVFRALHQERLID